MIPLTAKDNYHKTHTEKERSDLLMLIQSTPVKTLAVYAIAHLVEIGATKEQLSGARAFSIAFFNMAEPHEIPQEFKPVQLERVPNTPDGR